MRLQLYSGCTSDAILEAEEVAGNLGEAEVWVEQGRRKRTERIKSRIGVRRAKGRRGKGESWKIKRGRVSVSSSIRLSICIAPASAQVVLRIPVSKQNHRNIDTNFVIGLVFSYFWLQGANISRLPLTLWYNYLPTTPILQSIPRLPQKGSRGKVYTSGVVRR